jgi:hypothetical protein
VVPQLEEERPGISVGTIDLGARVRRAIRRTADRLEPRVFFKWQLPFSLANRLEPCGAERGQFLTARSLAKSTVMVGTWLSA